MGTNSHPEWPVMREDTDTRRVPGGGGEGVGLVHVVRFGREAFGRVGVHDGFDAERQGPVAAVLVVW